MAITEEKSSGTVVQAWLPHPLDKELRKHAEAERGSLSQTIRLAVEDKLLAEPELRLWIAKTASALARDGLLTGDEVEALRPDRLTVELQEAA